MLRTIRDTILSPDSPGPFQHTLHDWQTVSDSLAATAKELAHKLAHTDGYVDRLCATQYTDCHLWSITKQCWNALLEDVLLQCKPLAAQELHEPLIDVMRKVVKEAFFPKRNQKKSSSVPLALRQLILATRKDLPADQKDVVSVIAQAAAVSPEEVASVLEGAQAKDMQHALAVARVGLTGKQRDDVQLLAKISGLAEDDVNSALASARSTDDKRSLDEIRRQLPREQRNDDTTLRTLSGLPSERFDKAFATIHKQAAASKDRVTPGISKPGITKKSCSAGPSQSRRGKEKPLAVGAHPSLCMDPTHVTRQGTNPRKRDCAKCNGRARERGLCSHHKGTCQAQDCTGCKQRYGCSQCNGCHCQQNKKLLYMCQTCSPENFCQHGTHKYARHAKCACWA